MVALTRRESKARNRELKAETEAAVAEFGDPRKNEGTLEIERKGARRKRISVDKSFYPVLTHRQREELNGQVRLSAKMGRLYTMARGDGTEMSMEEFVEGLSNEELVRGQIKDKNGTFRGQPPQWVPRAFHRACIGELMRRGKKLYQMHYLEAIEAMTAIAVGEVEGAKVRDRITAAQFVIERIEGKVPDIVKVESEQPWMLLLDGIVAEVSDEQVAKGQRALRSAEELKGELNNIIIEGELEDDDDYEDELEEAQPEPVAPPARRRRPRGSAAMKRPKL